ncbi:MAG TPA: cyclopropane-fatty-acyl-phospholipid synthase family protein [Gemmataceae bacterium]|nr:cyclopropane-fatty-acyl-phospholipid synthase family protein [Gemmataceae bacterium]
MHGDNAANPVEIRIADARAYTTLATRGTLGAAAAFIDGWWDCDDLIGLFRLLTKNAETMAALDGAFSRWATWASAWMHRFRRNTIEGSRDNIHAHYDLGNEFFALFLDETMAYSAGIFSAADTTLTEASTEKFDRICRMLNLTPGDHVLEIGTGWGGFAVHAARKYGCKVTTTTISRNQYDFAKQRIRAAGLCDRVTVLCEDYRRLHGAFDKLVSIEMVEAVGHEFLDTYFRQCSNLLRPNGAMALQTITIPDQRYDAYRRSVDFIQRYIFPGGCIPCISAIADSVRRASDFRMTRLDDFGSHYAETLKHWRIRFWQNVDAVRGLGFDERFVRMWHYYLCYCEAGFLDRQIGLAQIMLSKPACGYTATI